MLNQRMRTITSSLTAATDARVKAMLAQGMDVINLSVGEPDVETPHVAKRGGIDAIEQGFTRYTAVAGIPDLRRAIACKLRDDNGIDYTPQHIVVSNGVKQALYNAFMVLLDPDDEVIIPSPYWVSFPEQVILAGGVPVIVPTDESTGFKITPAQIRSCMTRRTKIVVLNSPSNPTGVVYSRTEIEAIAALASEHGLIVFSDEIYEKLCYGSAKHVSIASLGPEIKRLTLTFNGFSKAYAMTGWRLGYVACEPEIATAMTALQGHATSAPSSITQMAALAALEGDQQFIEEMRRAYDERRGYVLRRLRSMRGLRVHVVPEGAFYLFPRVSDLFGTTIRGHTIATSDDLVAAVLEESRVALVAGSAFGSPAFIRLSYAASPTQLAEACDRLEVLLAQVC